MKEKLLLVFNKVEQVKKYAESMLESEVVSVKPVIIIGSDTRGNFLSSTDWLIELVDGEQRVLPFQNTPQHTSFVELMAGVSYGVDLEGKFFAMPDLPEFLRCAEVSLDGKIYEFSAGKPLIIEVLPGSKFVVTDCPVFVDDDPSGTFYHVMTDDAVYAHYQRGEIVLL